MHAEESWWAQKIDTICCLILLGVIAGGISVLYFPSNQFFNFYFQLLGVHLLLNIVLGLTKVYEQTRSSKTNTVHTGLQTFIIGHLTSYNFYVIVELFSYKCWD